MKRVTAFFSALLFAVSALAGPFAVVSSASPFQGSYTYATIPTCTAARTGATARATDVGVAPGMMLACDGTRWVPDGLQVLGRGATPASAGADTTEDTLATITVPANLMALNGRLRITTMWTHTNSGNNKTLRVRFSGAAGTAFTALVVTAFATTAAMTTIANRASASSQVGNSATLTGVGNSGSAVVTASVDTSAADTTVVITGQKATAGETLTLESYIVEVMQ